MVCSEVAFPFCNIIELSLLPSSPGDVVTIRHLPVDRDCPVVASVDCHKNEEFLIDTRLCAWMTRVSFKVESTRELVYRSLV